MLHHLTPEISTEIILHLQPRHVYKLMRTNRAMYEQCTSKVYWERVAFHLAFRGHIFNSKIIHDLYDMALLRMGYKRAMDTFIEAVRQDIHASPNVYWADKDVKPPPNADGPLSELIPYALDLSEYISTPQADMRLQARDLMLDTESTNYQVLNMLDGTHHNVFVSQRGVVPVTDGTYITESRRMHQASAHFLQALEDEPGLDLDVKRRILASAVQLVKDICEKRETVDWATGVTTRREDPIHHYEWVSIMRPPWTPETNMEPAE